MAAVYRPPEFGDQFPDGCVYCYNNQYNGLTIHTVLFLSGIKIKYLVLKSSLNLSLITVRFLRNILLFHEFPGSILKVAEINLYLLGIYDDKLQM